MGKSTFEKNGGYFIDGVAYMDCKVTGEPVANVSEDSVSVIGSRAVMGMVGMPDEPKQKVSTGRPAGWHFMNEFVDKDGNVFHKGKEQILLDRQKEKKAALKKAVQKQKDFINHKFGD